MELMNKNEKPVAKAKIIFNSTSKQPPRGCNICGHKFQPHSKYERFCESCREHSSSYHYGEWMISAS